MLEKWGFGTERIVYVELLDEGVFVMRPAPSEWVGGNVYRLLPVPDYDEDLETWKFPPGSEVECALEDHRGERVLVAQSAAASGALRAERVYEAAETPPPLWPRE